MLRLRRLQRLLDPHVLSAANLSSCQQGRGIHSGTDLCCLVVCLLHQCNGFLQEWHQSVLLQMLVDRAPVGRGLCRDVTVAGASAFAAQAGD